MIKYTVLINTQDLVSWRANIYSDDYIGEPIMVRSVADQAFELDYDGEVDDPFSVFIKSTLTLNLYNSGQIDISELQNAGDKQFKIELQREGRLKWVGYLIADSIQYALKSSTAAFTVTAIDGLNMLSGIEYSHDNLPGITSAGSRCPMNYIRQVLFSQKNLGLMLPIRWTNDLRNTVFEGQDMFVGDVEWSTTGEGFTSYQSGPNGSEPGPNKKCDYILEEILRSCQCRIYQSNGKWVIRRVNDYYTGTCNSYQIEANLGIFKISKGVDNIAKNIGSKGYPFINEDAIMTSLPGLKSCKVTYQANVRENILPNGDQDITSFAAPLYWGFVENTGGARTSEEGSLDGRTGYATELSNFGSETTNYTLISEGGGLYGGGLPIDARTLVKRISFSFLFVPKLGFPYFTSSGFIDWSTKPLQLQVVLNQGSNRYYLDEFGLWKTDINTVISPTVEALKVDDVGKINFDKFKGVIIPDPGFQPNANTVCDIKIIFRVKGNQQYLIDNISVTTETSNDVYVSTFGQSKNTKEEEATLGISSSFGGYMLSNFMTNWDRSDTESEFKDGNLYTGTLTGLCAAARMRFRYLSSKIFNGSISTKKKDWSFDEIYLIESFSDRKFMPLNAKYNVEKCEVNLIAIESRNDDIALTEKYYGSNDKQLSN